MLHRFKDAYFKVVAALGLGGPRIAKEDRVNIHCLRHTWASRMVESGADLILVQQLGGWSSLAMVQRYAHFRPERAVDATARMLAARPKSPQLSPRPVRVARQTR